MKVEAKRIKPDFQPMEVRFVIETEKEYQALVDLFSADVSVPNLLERYGHTKDKDLVSKLMDNLRSVIVDGYDNGNRQERL